MEKHQNLDLFHTIVKAKNRFLIKNSHTHNEDVIKKKVFENDGNSVYYYCGDKSIPYKPNLKTDLCTSKKEYFSIFEAEQVHSNHVEIMTSASAKIAINADALVTNEPGLLLLIRTADCYPVLCFDNFAKVIGIAHAGRKGVEGNILRETVKVMQQLTAKIENIQIIFGAGICGEHYPVDNKTFTSFLQNTGYNQNFPNLNLKSVLYEQAFQLGIPTSNIREISRCTFSDKNLFSYRENKTIERQISLLGMDTWK